MPDKKVANRMANVIRRAIVDKDLLHCLTPQDLMAVLANTVNTLTPSDVRGFIYRCITNSEEVKALIMADRAIDYALEMYALGDGDGFSEIVGAAVGTLSMMSSNSPTIKEKINELLGHPHPEIVVAVVENLGHTSNLDNFNRVSDLLLKDDMNVSSAAAEYVEACARDAAFRKRREFHVIDSSAEAFLRSALLKLESIYHQVKANPGKSELLARRLAILVALIYNEVLDSTDWRRFRSEDVDERVYYALEQHLLDDIGPDALPYLVGLLKSSEIECGVKRSALHTLGRLSKQPSFRTRIQSWLPEFLKNETSDELIPLATSILDACRMGNPFSVLMCLPETETSLRNIVPRTCSNVRKGR